MLKEGAHSSTDGSLTDAVERPRHPLGDKMLTEREVRDVFEGVDGIKRSIPARCYYDEDIYKFEVNHILKKNWLCVGRWDQAKNAGDYFTHKMFGESIVIVRDKAGELHAHANVCRHRWSRLVPEGSGNMRLFVCPYHSWTYELDGRLRGVAVSELPGLDKKNCNLHSLRLEEWEGYIFINFDKDAEPLGPQLAEVSEMIEEYKVGTFLYSGETTYNTSWNYKFSFETGYEGYHSEGVHRHTLGGFGKLHRPFKFGKIWGSYIGEYAAGDMKALGTVPWMQEGKTYPDYMDATFYVAIYPNLIMVLTPYMTQAIVTQHIGTTNNIATTFLAIAPWVRERTPELEAGQVEFMKTIQVEDTEGCKNLQAGVTSSFNDDSFVHPLETQLSHYYQWFADQYLKAGPARP